MRKMLMTKVLSPKQRRFVMEYLIDLNGTKAAIRAGYSPKTVYSIASENLRKPEVEAAIAQAQHARELRTEISQDRILKELAQICLFDVRTLYNPDGTFKHPLDLNDDAAAGVARIQILEMHSDASLVASDGKIGDLPTRTTNIRIFDKISALSLAMRHVGILDGRRNEQFSSEGTPQGVINVTIGDRNKSP